MLEMILDALKNGYVEQHGSSAGLSRGEQRLALLQQDGHMTIPRMAEQIGGRRTLGLTTSSLTQRPGAPSARRIKQIGALGCYGHVLIIVFK